MTHRFLEDRRFDEAKGEVLATRTRHAQRGEPASTSSSTDL
jgi:hypothetical protein